ncbi:pollen-specific leucine-rich repeat extensin-like protein 4 [Iris pallida]|uniref:Pollen-specific leucine-rich repeat extensin-like protein 4 n=1 Tax=Iris pallida TaxID=29817 RepID=A0AAX6G0T7_IRIPA|nr:pollen-specific leucine-rich repeat extensin-like protein 4 [Iris pallida]
MAVGGRLDGVGAVTCPDGIGRSREEVVVALSPGQHGCCDAGVWGWVGPTIGKIELWREWLLWEARLRIWWWCRQELVGGC